MVSGLFRGMQLIRIPGQLRLAHKLLGTYELELVPFLEEIIKSDYDVIINLGAVSYTHLTLPTNREV